MATFNFSQAVIPVKNCLLSRVFMLLLMFAAIIVAYFRVATWARYLFLPLYSHLILWALYEFKIT